MTDLKMRVDTELYNAMKAIKEELERKLGVNVSEKDVSTIIKKALKDNEVKVNFSVSVTKKNKEVRTDEEVDFSKFF